MMQEEKEKKDSFFVEPLMQFVYATLLSSLKSLGNFQEIHLYENIFEKEKTF
jgi:hypothetical protein